MSCKCKICSGHRKVEEIIKSKNVNKLIKLVHKLEDENLHLGSDIDYYKAILEGCWPSSPQILTKALERAKKYASKSS